MAYNNLITRDNVDPLVPEDVSNELLAAIGSGSFVLKLARRLKNMSTSVRRLPVLSALPEVYFVGEAGRSPQTFDEVKQTTGAEWGNKFLNVEELACIIPIPENVLDDGGDFFADLKPEIVAAFGTKIDSAILFGESNVTVPVAWPDGVVTGMPADHLVTLGEVGDLYDDIFGVGGVISKVEEDGYFVNGMISAMGLRAQLRGLRDGTTGAPLFNATLQAATPYSLDGQQLEFPTNGAFDTTLATLIAGDWRQLVWAMRKDITYKVLTEGVITDNSTPRVIIHNLAQDDMVALRVTFRMAWQLPNPTNRLSPVDAERYPFSALVPVGS